MDSFEIEQREAGSGSQDRHERDRGPAALGDPQRKHDIDPQFNASQYLLGARRYQASVVDSDAPTIWDIFEQNTRVPGRQRRKIDTGAAVREITRYYDGSCVHLIPSRLELAFSLKHPGHKDALLARAISEIDARRRDGAPLFQGESAMTPARLVVSVRPSVVRVMTVPLASTGNPCSGATSNYAMGM